MIRLPSSIALLSLLLSTPVRAEDSTPPKKASRAAAAEGGATYALFVTSRGKIAARLLPDEAPNAVRNFVELAAGKKSWKDPTTGKESRAPLYDGTLFHRVIPGFMIQGGDPMSRGRPPGADPSYGMSGPGYKFDDELKAGSHPFESPCQLAMANSGPNTNGSQFFITEVATPHLDPVPCGNSPTGICGYVHFGVGICGCERVRAIAEAGNSQTRLEKVRILHVKPSCD
jgi:peptidyl-prolyl cis-trans isomerase A (cyclophilin A)